MADVLKSVRYTLKDGRSVTVTWLGQPPYLKEEFDGGGPDPAETLTTQVDKAARRGFRQAQPPEQEAG